MSGGTRPEITAVDGDVTLRGTGGAGTDSAQTGIYIFSGLVQTSGTTANTANIVLEGTGGSGNGVNIGVRLEENTREIDVTTVDGNITISGTGGSNGSFNHGVLIYSDTPTVAATGTTSSAGDVSIVGIPGAASSGNGIELSDSPVIGDANGLGDVTLTSDDIEISATAAIQGKGDLTIKPTTAATNIDIGGGSATLTIDDNEITALKDGFASITIGDSTSGSGVIDISSATFLDPLTLTTSGSINDNTGTDLTAPSVSMDGSVAPGQSPGVLVVSGNYSFADNSAYSAELGGATAGTGTGFHDQIDVTGTVTIGASVALNLSVFGGFTPAVNNNYILINNDSNDAIVGTFNGLSEGHKYTNFLSTGLDAYLTYKGGDGNDVAVTIYNTDVSISANNLLIEDVQGADSDDTITLSVVSSGGGDKIRVNDPNNLLLAGSGATQIDLNTVEVPVASITGSTGVHVDTKGGDDTLTLNFGGTGGLFDVKVKNDGGETSETGGDTMVLTGGANFTNATFNFNDVSGGDEHNGTIALTGNQTITYTGLEPITSTVSATNVTLDYDTSAQTITVADSGSAGQTKVSANANAEVITFANPSGSLTINAGDTNNDTITVNGFGSGVAAHVKLNGEGGAADVVNWNTATTVGGLTSNVETTNLKTNVSTNSAGQTYQGNVKLEGDLTLTDSSATGVLFNGTVNSTTTSRSLAVVASNASSEIEFQAAVGATAPSLDKLTLTNAGLLDIQAAADFNLGGFFKQDGAGVVSLAGDVTTTADDISFATNVTLTGNVALNTGATGGAVTFTGKVDDDTATSDRTLQVTAGTGDVKFSSAVGSTLAPSAITIASAGDLTFSSTVATDGNLQQTTGGGTTTFNGTSGSGVGGALDIKTEAITLSTSTFTTAGTAKLDSQQAVTLNTELNAGASAITILANQDGAGADDFQMNAGAAINTTNATSSAVSITVGGSGDAHIRGITTGANGRVTFTTGGAITDVGVPAANNVTTTQLLVTSSTGFGTSGNPIETTVSKTEIVGGAGGVFLDNTGDLEIGITNGISTTSGNIDVSSTGSITVTKAASSSGGGSVTATADTHVNINANISSNNGNVTILADNAAGANSGVVKMTDGTKILAGSGAVDIDADGDITLGHVKTTSTSLPAVDINTANGNIVDGGDMDVDIEAPAISLEATKGAIGTTTATEEIDTKGTNLDALADGDIVITNDGPFTIGGADATLTGVDSANGAVQVTATSPLTVSENTTGDSIVLTATDDADDVAGKVDILKINTGIKVISDNGNITLNGGDQVDIDGEVEAANPGNTAILTINVDNTATHTTDPDNTDKGVEIDGIIDIASGADLSSDAGAFFNGGSDNDTFNFRPQEGTEITVDGNDPTFAGAVDNPVPPGDVLNLDLTGIAAGNTYLNITGAGAGTYSFAIPETKQDVNYQEIETNQTSVGDVHLVLDMKRAGFETGGGDDDTTEAKLNAAGDRLELYVDGVQVFDGDNDDIHSLTIIGSADDDKFQVTETAGGLPNFNVAAPSVDNSGSGGGASLGSHLNASADSFLTGQFGGSYDSDDVTIHFDGGGGTNSFGMTSITDHDVQYFSDKLDTANTGNVSSFDGAGAPTDIDFGLSFANLAP
ncbi:MAG: hypothetical protein QGG36_30580, partial [Pirellulaceae bacterium]|nr:hypothetical protein [Pirellulaceae bacterium]